MGEKRRFFSEEEIEKFMSQFPPIEDKRSKAKIYEQIQIKMKAQQQQRKVTKKRWIPLVTASVILIFFIVMSPSFLNQEQGLDESAKESLEISLFDAKDRSLNGVAELNPDADPIGTKRMITVPYIDQNDEFIIPLSFELGAFDNAIEKMHAYLNAGTSENLPSIRSELFAGIELKEENGELIVDIPDERFSQGAATTTLFIEGVQIILDSLQYEKAILRIKGEPAVQLDHYGEVSKLENKRQTGGYFLYRTPEGKPVLVPGELSYFNRVPIEDDKQFVNVLHEMEFPQEIDTVASPFPAGVSIEQLHIEKNEAFIVLNGGEKLGNNEEAELFIDAILLTANQFDIDFITFIGTSGQQIGPYLLTERLDTNIVPNRIS